MLCFNEIKPQLYKDHFYTNLLDKLSQCGEFLKSLTTLFGLILL